MKTLKTLILVMILTSYAASASIETWEGQGDFFNLNGDLVSSYSLKVENNKTSPDQTESQITITLSDGTVRTDKCSISYGKKGWTSQCSNTQGGGQCYGQGLCQSYMENGNTAYATTIVMDGPKQMRLLRTQLVNGEAASFSREKLFKK